MTCFCTHWSVYHSYNLYLSNSSTSLKAKHKHHLPKVFLDSFNQLWLLIFINSYNNFYTSYDSFHILLYIGIIPASLHSFHKWIAQILLHPTQYRHWPNTWDSIDYSSRVNANTFFRLLTKIWSGQRLQKEWSIRHIRIHWGSKEKCLHADHSTNNNHLHINSTCHNLSIGVMYIISFLFS